MNYLLYLIRLALQPVYCICLLKFKDYSKSIRYYGFLVIAIVNSDVIFLGGQKITIASVSDNP